MNGSGPDAGTLRARQALTASTTPAAPAALAALAALHALARPPEAVGPTASGPLDGMMLAVKDNIAVGGLAHEGASPALAGHVATSDAGSVARLRAAGAGIAMQTNLHELAFGITSANAHLGTVLNPWDARRVAGGSSGGTAVAVATGAVVAGLGTDTGGSGRIPAALCGCTGLRPTTGRYPGDGVLTLSASLDTVSAMARDVTTLARVDAVLADLPGSGDVEPAAAQGIVLGLARDPFWTGASKDVAARTRTAIDALRRAGFGTVVVDDPALARAAALSADIALPLVIAETARFWRSFARERLGIELEALVARIASADVAAIFAMIAASTDDPDAYRELLARRDEARAAMDGLWERHGIDALVHPANPARAPALDELASVDIDGTLHDTFGAFTTARLVASVAATPALVLPVGLDGAGMPIGLELVGRAGSDRRLLAVAATIEASFDRLPPSPAGGAS